MEINSLASPLVSIIIPVYNSEKYISETIRSVSDQTYQKIEIIVIDDKSTDSTNSIVQNLALSYPIVLISNTDNKGASASRNIGYKAAKGEFIKFLDGDDLLNNEAIAEQVKLAVKNPDSIVSGKWARFYNDDISNITLNVEKCWKTLESTDWICSSWEDAQPMTTPGIFLIPKTVIDKAGLWNEALSLIDDFEYFARTILAVKCVVFCSKSTLYYRSGNKNVLSATKSRQGYESAYLSLEKGITNLLNKRTDLAAQKACANLWALFIFEIYPYHPDLASEAKKHLSSLPLPTVKFPAGGLSKLLLSILGWKIVKRLQLFKSKLLS